ncbi:cytochrome P450 [Fomitiporia mediterranea MF3/22]|uniref:cytochrome P450 n=1 Tax=Fomitiporia mediterranea (strain MF3/22) TaxID=694068 RepID=UPI00044088F0|nr:cytochrome P450 [Fomitiporia mediterranea MF3/22]EJC99756.1 cytochrome P450 [Fomitiporia mediterranea MF3/22]
MLLQPHIAKKAQVELDKVIGNKRLPALQDRDALPYIDCIMKECLRWRPPAPLGLPHRATQSGELKGRHIPKGSVVIANIWHMTHSERNYSHPDDFDPDRFMGVHPEMEPSAAVFGFGRRICPGRVFAEASLWLVIANILAVFDISPAADDQGNEILPQVDVMCEQTHKA